MKAGPMPKFNVDPKLVRKLATLLEETGLTEIEYRNGGEQIRVSRLAPAADGGNKAPVASPSAAEAERSEVEPAGILSAPMVGTVYTQANPDAEPFVKPGDRVEKGQTVLIIEAMKVMNPIPAPTDGTVKAVFVVDRQPVEFGEPLMIID